MEQFEKQRASGKNGFSLGKFIEKHRKKERLINNYEENFDKQKERENSEKQRKKSKKLRSKNKKIKKIKLNHIKTERKRKIPLGIEEQRGAKTLLSTERSRF